MLPVDISGFAKAMPTSMTMAKQRAIEEQLQNTASGASAGANMQAGGWRKKWQESMTAKVGKTPPPQLSEEQKKTYDALKSTPMAVDDPRAKMFAGLDESQLSSVGVKKITQDGKDFFKYTAPTVSDEEVKRAIASQGNFEQRASAFMPRLQKDLNITKEQAAGIIGSLGGETGGLKAVQELHPVIPGSRGGFGWAQWTGPRRVEFEQFSAARGLSITSDEANYQFLVHELKGSESKALNQLKQTGSVDEAARVFTGSAATGIGYLRPGIEHYGSSISKARQAYGAIGITNDYSDKSMELAREKLIRNMEANRIGTLAEYTNAGLPAPGSPEASAIVGDTKGANAVASKIKDQFGNLSNPQCVALAKAYVGSNSSVTEWRRGSNVMDGTLKPGTPIATFMDRKGNPSSMYDGGQGVGAPGNHTTHAAVFLDYQRDGAGKITGIRVMEQYKGSGGAHERTYPVGGFGTNNAANYHSINDKSGAPLGSTNPMVQNAAVDPPKTPLADYTSKVPMQANPPPKPVEAKPANKDNAQPPKQVKANAKGGINKINTEQISAYPIGGAQGDNAVVVNAQQQPLFTMNTNEKMLIDPKKDTAQVIPDQKPDVSQKPTQDTGVMDEFKAAIQELKNEFSQNDPGKFKQPDMPNRETFDKDTQQGHILDGMNDLSKEWYSTPSMKRAAFRTGGVETGEPVSNFHYSHGNRS
jgi:hypothetical protein